MCASLSTRGCRRVYQVQIDSLANNQWHMNLELTRHIIRLNVRTTDVRMWILDLRNRSGTAPDSQAGQCLQTRAFAPIHTKSQYHILSLRRACQYHKHLNKSATRARILRTRGRDKCVISHFIDAL